LWNYSDFADAITEADYLEVAKSVE
jgi:hypothetical protein